MAEGKRETARLVHKDFFDRCQFAIDQGFYLEALAMEYSAIEGRVKVIMSIIGMPCSLCEDTSITYEIGLTKKLGCLRQYLQNDVIFGNSKLTPTTITKIRDWCSSRNERMHRLYADVEKYEKLMGRNKKYAEKGLEYAKLLYKEANRLKYMSKHHPEKLENIKFECNNPHNTCGLAIV